jgi:membrane-bound lytic murein transglycosylase D
LGLTSQLLTKTIAGLLALSFAGCLGLAHRVQRVDASDDATRRSPRQADGVAETSTSETASNTLPDNSLGNDVLNDPLAPTAEQKVRQRLAEAQALFANGFAANLDGRWYDAQVAFEQATNLVAEADLQPYDSLGVGSDVIGSDLREELSTLLSEIAHEYRKTLVAIGDLDSDASLMAFLLRYESLESVSGEEAGADTAATVIIADEEEESAQVEYDFPIELNDQVTNCIVYFQTVAREPFETYLRRAGRYLPMMKEIVVSYGLPSDLAYLPLIESGFNSKAYSYAHASGPWQFIASTGRKYGLVRNAWYDERRDFEKSTHAACQYLRDLYGMFDSWTLALAAYNGGEGRVGRQIKRQNTTDFWKLNLHTQTRNYVPLYMGALMIAKDPESFGFHVEPDPPLEYDWVATNKPIETKDVAKALGCSVETLADLNPELRRNVTPPDIKPYRLRVPKGTGELFSHIYHHLPESERTQWAQHTVRRGETLSAIARRYGISSSEIARHNKLKSQHTLSVGQTLEIPVPTGALADNYDDNSDDSPAPSRSSSGSTKGSKYTVKRGDSLWELAKKFGTTTSAIRRINGMGAHDPLVAGRMITVPGAGSEREAGSFYYTIRRGDTMSTIAGKFGIALKKLMASNQSINPNRISAGQRILIPGM